MATQTEEQLRAELGRAGQDHLIKYVDNKLKNDAASKAKFMEDVRKARPEVAAQRFKAAMAASTSDDAVGKYSYEPPAMLGWPTTQPDDGKKMDAERDRQLSRAGVAASTDSSSAPEEWLKRWRQKGLDIVANNELAVLIMAGGDGTRLGYQGPKGCLPTGPVSGLSLFGIFAQRILKLEQLAGGRGSVLLLVMGSDKNLPATVEHFEANKYFGLKKENVILFPQTMVPAHAVDGKLLLASPGQLFMAPNGNGGALTSLQDTGTWEIMQKRGVKWVNVMGVDNCLALPGDPVFVGYSADVGAEGVTKTCARRNAAEKAGVFVKKIPKGSGVPRGNVVEYICLPKEVADSTNENGALLYSETNILQYVFEMNFLKRVMAEGANAMPYYVARKKIPHVDPETGETVTPTEPNAIKLETFLFDVFDCANRVYSFKVPRESEFAPIKSKDGEDSLAVAQAMMTALHRKWLSKAPNAGEVPSSGKLELPAKTTYCGEGQLRVADALTKA
eukprot:GHVU01052558.1.p1 GENE.GHVU01052558.1~~GHVU01052558.1.p1  ORF type:complete len:504 (+),score=112.50 GHVU01052558.1:80-1591(+)